MSTLSQFSSGGAFGAIGDLVPMDFYLASNNMTMNGREYIATGLLKNYNNTYLTCVTSNKMFGWYNVSANGFDVTWYTPIPTYTLFKMERAGPYLHYINLNNGSSLAAINVKFGTSPNVAAAATTLNIASLIFTTDSTTFQNVAYISGRDSGVAGGENMSVYRCGPPTANQAYIRILTVADSFNTVGRFIMANSNTTIIAVRQQGLTNPGMGANVYNAGMISTSTDGINWVQRTPNLITSIGATLPGSNTSLFSRVRRLHWSPVINHFVYLMEDGSAFVSPDGYTMIPSWSNANAPLGMVGSYFNTNFGNPSWNDNFTDTAGISMYAASSPNTTIFCVGNDNSSGGNRLLRLTAGNTWQIINLANGITSYQYKDMDNAFVFSRFHQYTNRIVYDGTRWFLFNMNGYVAFSNDDGLTWQMDYRCYDSIKNQPTAGVTASIFAWNNMSVMNVPTLNGAPQVFAVGQVANPPTPYDMTYGPLGTTAGNFNPGTKLAKATPDLVGYLFSPAWASGTNFTMYLRLR